MLITSVLSPSQRFAMQNLAIQLVHITTFCLQNELAANASFSCTVMLPLPGGDLCTALAEDHEHELRWYAKGHLIALDIARGLFFLHSHDVRRLAVGSCQHTLHVQ